MKESSKRRDIRAPFHDKVHIIKPLLQTTGMILFFSWFFYRSVFAIIVFVIPFASLKAQTSYEKCCAPPLFDL